MKNKEKRDAEIMSSKAMLSLVGILTVVVALALLVGAFEPHSFMAHAISAQVKPLCGDAGGPPCVH